MGKKYDVIIIGAGPAGLMTAKTAAERDLKVLVFDKKKNISRIKRTCSAAFYFESNYMGETTQFEDNKLIFKNNGFTVDFSGSYWPIKEKYGFSPRGNKWHMVRFANEDYTRDTPLSVVLDKEALLAGLLAEAKNLGVTVMNAAQGRKIENTARGVEVEIYEDGRYARFEGAKAIVADGTNSKMVESMGLNKNRKVLGSRAMFVEYVMEGVENPFSHAVLNFYGKKIRELGSVHVWPNAKGFTRVLGFNNLTFRADFQYPEKAVQYFITESPYATWFKKAKVIEKTGGSLLPRAAIREPFAENILVIGDAAALIEVENQGALMCGFKAGNAVYDELNGLAGYKNYVEWWKHSFEFNNPELLKGMAVIPTLKVGEYSDEDIDYLFSLIDGQDLYGTCSQYRSGKAVWEAILQHRDTIAKEKPVLYEKVQKVMDLISGQL